MDLNLFIYHIYKAIMDSKINTIAAIALVLIYLFLSIFGMWKVFEKAGRKWWYACIPFFNYYQLFDIAWEGKYGIIFSVIEVLYMLLSSGQGKLLTKGFTGFFCMALFIASFIFLSFAKIKLAFSFKKGSIFCYGLIFLEIAFLIVLGLDDSRYLGPTLRRYNSETKQIHIRPGSSLLSQRRYMINLYKRRSAVALFAGSIVFVVSLAAIAGGLQRTYIYQENEPTYSLFHYFTINSNLLSATGAAFMIPYAVEGVRKKRFAFPKWVSLFQYSGAICTTLTMIFSIIFIFPTQGPEMAFGGMNFWLHIICPIMALVLLFMVEIDIQFSLSDTMACLVPFFLYSLVYIVNVVLLGEENGGWRDIYMINTYVPAAVSAPLIFMLGFAIAYVIRFFYNRLSAFRQKQLVSLWKDDASEVEINIEVYGLGRYNGKHTGHNNIAMPIDILEMLAEKYSLDLSRLCSIYNKGLIDGLKEQGDPDETLRENLAYLIGTPRDLSTQKSEEA